MRTFAAAAAAALVAALLPTSAASPAGVPNSPQPACLSEYLAHVALHAPDGTRMGELSVFGDSATGTKCAVTAAGRAPADVHVSLTICEETSPGPTCTRQEIYEAARYDHWAQTLPLHARGHCLQATGTIRRDGVTATGSTSPAATVCV
ncbi:hypothetical protein AB0I28_10315 [Phytomonospora sp. NPDC050363]|uniref:hypothetical protein n=1 Tax=Phytomonospora sp. NPDC050363 TaxID=3155642 RepID=UPI003403463C